VNFGQFSPLLGVKNRFLGVKMAIFDPFLAQNRPFLAKNHHFGPKIAWELAIFDQEVSPNSSESIFSGKNVKTRKIDPPRGS